MAQNALSTCEQVLFEKVFTNTKGRRMLLSAVDASGSSSGAVNTFQAQPHHRVYIHINTVNDAHIYFIRSNFNILIGISQPR